MPTVVGARSSPLPLLRPLQNAVCGIIWLGSPSAPPLSFGHFPRERGKPYGFATVSAKGEGISIHGGWLLDYHHITNPEVIEGVFVDLDA